MTTPDSNTSAVIDHAKIIHASHPGFSWHQLFALAAVALDLPDPDVVAALAETESLRAVVDHADELPGGEPEADLVQAACDQLGFEDDLCFAEMALRIYENRQRRKNGPPPVPPNLIPANNQGVRA